MKHPEKRLEEYGAHLVAQLQLPKQQMTRPFSVILAYGLGATGKYSTHMFYNDDANGMDHGHYDMDFEEAFADFQERAGRALKTGAKAYEPLYFEPETRSDLYV